MLIPCSPQCTLQLTLGSQPSTAAASLGPVGSGLGWLLCESESEACQKLMADLRPFSPPTGVPGGNRDCGLLPLAGSTKQVEPWLSASLAAPGLHPNQCAVHWPITCPKQQMRGLGGFCAHSWGPPICSGTEIEVEQDDATGGARPWSTPCFSIDWGFSSRTR